MTTQFHFEWTDDKINEMIGLYKKGHPAREIATIIGAPSKDAVLGKMHRLRGAGIKIDKLLSRPKMVPIKKIKIKIVEKPRLKELLHLKKNECRWPIDTAFCSNHTDGGSYCEKHKKEAYRKIIQVPDRRYGYNRN